MLSSSRAWGQLACPHREVTKREWHRPETALPPFAVNMQSMNETSVRLVSVRARVATLESVRLGDEPIAGVLSRALAPIGVAIVFWETQRVAGAFRERIHIANQGNGLLTKARLQQVLDHALAALSPRRPRRLEEPQVRSVRVRDSLTRCSSRAA